MDLDTLDSITLEMDAVALLIGSAAPCYEDLAPGLHALLRRWTTSLARIATSAPGAAGEVFTVNLTCDEAAALQARAVFEARTPEEQIRALVDSAIQRWENAECWP